MASIQKRGKGYRIIVSNGYDINVIIPGTFEPSVRSLRATLPAHRSQIFR